MGRQRSRAEAGGHRGRGYASACVAEVSRQILAAGDRPCLFTDQANPTSNKIYEALGYRRVVDTANVVVVADTDAEAQREFTTLQQMFLDLRAGRSRKIQPPVDPAQFAGAINPMLDISAVGSPDTVKAQLEEFIERTGADELITVTYAYDPAVRNRSIELLADLWF